MVQSSSSPQPPQNVAVVLRIGSGSFDNGFPVTLQIFDGSRSREYDNLPDIPAAPEMPQLYQEWQDITLKGSRRLQVVDIQITNRSEEEELQEWKQRAEKLKAYCRTWFKHQAFNSLSAHIRANGDVRTDRSVPIIIRCEARNGNQNYSLLRRLPWHFWDLFTDLPNAEFALFTRSPRQIVTLTAPIRVLAIFGSTNGDLQFRSEQEQLERLRQRGTEIVECSQPSETELTRLLFDETWDILFFAGHSSSTEANSPEAASGQIQIRENGFLHLDDLNPGLTRAVRNGLKLAIFNSCDGLGIAEALARSNVPAMIVMREPIPDQIAGLFFINFLKEFSQGNPLCLAVREARERLRMTEGLFPAASWLPVVCINPNQPELVWPPTAPASSLQSLPLLPHLSPRVRRRSFMIGFIALVVAIAAIVAPRVAIPIFCSILPSVCDNNHDLQVEQFISAGEKSIADSRVELTDLYFLLKQRGIEAFAAGQYSEAVKIFDDLRNLAKQNKNDPTLSKDALVAIQDPEILIYRNNAFVNDRHRQNPGSPIYTIAMATPLNNDAGMGIALGVAQAQDVFVNQQGINLQVVIANDSNRPEQAQQVAESLSNDPKILAVVGHYTSPNTCAGLQVYSPNNLVIISPTSTVVDLPSKLECGGDPNHVFFRTVSTTQVEAKTLIQYLINALSTPQPNIVAFYNSQEIFSTDLYNQFAQVLKAYGGTIIATVDLSDPNFDSSQLPPEVKAADALAVLPDGGTGNTIALQRAIQVIKLNNGEKPVLGANTLYLQSVVDEVGQALVNRLFVAVDWHPKQCGASAFAQIVNQYWGGDLNRRTALAYESVQAAVQAIKLSSNSFLSIITRQEVREKLSETGIKAEEPGVAASSAILEGSSITFDTRGDRREITTRAVVTVNEQLRFDLVKDVACGNP